MTTAMETAATALNRLTDTRKQLDNVEQQLAEARASRDVAAIGRLTTERDALREFAIEDDSAERATREEALHVEGRHLLDTLRQSYAKSVKESATARSRALGLLTESKAAISDSMQHYFHALWAQRSVE